MDVKYDATCQHNPTKWNSKSNSFNSFSSCSTGHMESIITPQNAVMFMNIKSSS